MAKLRQHHGQQPRIDGDVCRACGVCAEWCPADAIVVEEQARIDGGRCIGCGECVATCREGAVDFDWAIAGRELSERIVDHAAGAIRGKAGRVAFVTVAQQITRNCDCVGIAEDPLLDDIGILASRDPVAIDAAVLDLVRQRAGRSLEELAHPHHDAGVQIRYGEIMGLGSSAYDLVAC
jgi:uncharacterized Fe-S center protein